MDFVHGQPAVQHQGLGPQRGGPALAVRRAAGRQRQLRVDPAHPVQARPRRQRRRGDGQRLDVVELRRRGRDPRRRSSRPTWSRAWSPCRRSCSAAPASRCACGSSPRTRPPGAGSVDRTGQVLFIDARDLGYMVDRAERALSRRRHRARSPDTFHAWRGTASAAAKRADVRRRPGLLLVGDARGDQGRRLRADAGPVRRRRRGRGRRRADRGEDRAADARSCSRSSTSRRGWRRSCASSWGGSDV